MNLVDLGGGMMIIFALHYEKKRCTPWNNFLPNCCFYVFFLPECELEGSIILSD